MSLLGATAGEWRMQAQLTGQVLSPQGMSMDRRARILHAVALVRDSAGALGLVSASLAGEEAFKHLLNDFAGERRYSAVQLNDFTAHLDRLIFSYTAEMGARLMFVMSTAHVGYYSDDTRLFGAAVEEAFPTALPEIVDAAKCRALGRWTATVFHLMRALEPALNALARSVDVQPEQNWNTALNQIEAKLRLISKAKDGPDAEQWAAEAAAHFRAIKNGWRNHAAHGGARYDEEQAVAIFDNVKAFMQTLARRLAE